MIGAFVGAVSGVFLRTWANQLGKQRRFARKSDSIPSTTCHYLTDVLLFNRPMEPLIPRSCWWIYWTQLHSLGEGTFGKFECKAQGEGSR